MTAHTIVSFSDSGEHAGGVEDGGGDPDCSLVLGGQLERRLQTRGWIPAYGSRRKARGRSQVSKSTQELEMVREGNLRGGQA